MSTGIRELAENSIWVRGDGVLLYESVLQKYLKPERLKRLLDIVADNVGDDGIAWLAVWDEMVRT